jgi:hypothetical protein
MQEALELDLLSSIINQNNRDYYFPKRKFAKALESYGKAQLGEVEARGPTGRYGKR